MIRVGQIVFSPVNHAQSIKRICAFRVEGLRMNEPLLRSIEVAGFEFQSAESNFRFSGYSGLLNHMFDPLLSVLDILAFNCLGEEKRGLRIFWVFIENCQRFQASFLSEAGAPL